MATKADNRPLIWVLAGSAILFVVCVANQGGGNTPRADVGEAVGAWVVCQQFVEDQLKAPATAKYPSGYSDYTRSLGGGTFQVDAFVDSENSFGAMIRTDFSCTVDYRGDDNWHLESLTFSD